jgi:hypothetical protein
MPLILPHESVILRRCWRANAESTQNLAALTCQGAKFIGTRQMNFCYIFYSYKPNKYVV